MLYSSKKFAKKIEIYQENGIIYYKEITLSGKKVYQIPLDRLDRTISFSRTYHAAFFLPPAFLGFLSLRLIFKKWHVGDWTLYLGFTVISLIFIGLVYYLTVGKHSGEVELNFGDLKLPLYMKKDEYLKFQERLAHLDQ